MLYERRMTSSQALVLCVSAVLIRYQTSTHFVTARGNSMPGGLGAGLGLGGKTAYGLPPPLSRTQSMHPAEMTEFELSLEGDLESQAPSEVPSPHEPLKLDWPAGDSSAQQEVLHHLPSLPPLETAPLGGPLTRSFNTILHDDAKFLRPAPKSAVTRHITPTPLAASKKRRAETAAEPSTPLASSTPATSHVPPAPRKKRRGLRPGTYLCLFKGELYECPHGCDIVDKSLLYDLLRRQ